MLEQFRRFVDELKASNSRLHKEAVLKAYECNDNIKRIVKFIFNPYVVTGISKKKFYKGSVPFPNTVLPDIKAVMDYLTEHNHGSDQDIANIQEFCIGNKGYEDIIYAIVCKDLTVGVTATTINKVWGKNFIPQFSVMLAEKYFDDPVKYLPEGTQFILTEKLDGVRCVLLFDENKEPHFFSRNGKEIVDLVDLAKEAKQLDPNYVYDGELLANTVGHSKDVYRDTMSIVGSDNVKTGVLYNVFDKVLRKDFEAGVCNIPCIERKQSLSNEVTCDKFKFIRNVPMLYLGDNQERIQEYLKWAKDNGKEGIMINWCTGPYECKRSRKLLKVKVFSTMDLRVVGIEEGEGRNAGKLGNFVCSYRGTNVVRVGSGITDEEREQLWHNRHSLLGKIIEVSYFEETSNKTGGYSLRFPTYRGIRFDKNTADYE